MKRIFMGGFLAVISLASFAQSKAEEFAQKYEAYQEVFPKTNIYLTLNQPKYSPGDTVFFNAYFLKEDKNWIQGKQLLDLNLVDTEGRSLLRYKFGVFDGTGYNQFVIPESIPSGSYLLTVHSSWMLNFDPPGIFQKGLKIVSEEALGETNASYVEGGSNSRERSETAKIELAKQVYQVREKARINLSLMGENGQPTRGEFSIKVLNRSLFEEASRDNLLDQTKISSALNSPKPALVSPSQEPKYFYSSTLEKNGTAYYADTSEPLEDFTQIVFYLQGSHWRYQTFANNGGRVSLAIPDFYGDDEFFYLAMSKRREEINNIRIEWDEEPALKLPMASIAKKSEQIDPYASFVEKRKIINRSYDFYTSGLIAGPEGAGMAKLEETLGGADVSLNVDDYARFSTMNELIKEVIKFMKVRGSGEKTRVRISLLEPPIGDPLYVIDGIATKSTAFFLSLKPAELATIKIIKDHLKLPKLGLFGKNGIVLVETKKGNVREPLDDQSKRIEGLNKPIMFDNITEADIQKTNVPLFRSTIYWSPSVVTDENGKAAVEFFTSDDIGTYLIQVDGFTDEGEPFSIQETIEVKTNNP